MKEKKATKNKTPTDATSFIANQYEVVRFNNRAFMLAADELVHK
ncbi:hypothetical protein KDH_20190 [Dictyobacter sp. S3.2.2.5]|uniref:Uncharacterized protein n=1 Tax=Dictyobacter halimunensis TaxID=3026934 RepID=A0ABQ6FN90_9CHLR|nr:hypothetical protein KDH_20190 [Dictyobacter sp. S3.2.2.5]